MVSLAAPMLAPIRYWGLSLHRLPIQELLTWILIWNKPMASASLFAGIKMAHGTPVVSMISARHIEVVHLLSTLPLHPRPPLVAPNHLQFRFPLLALPTSGSIKMVTTTGLHYLRHHHPLVLHLFTELVDILEPNHKQ